MLNDILWPDHIQWQPPTDQTLYRTRPFTEFWVVSIEHLRRLWHADRGRLLLHTPGPSLSDLHMFYLWSPILFPNLLIFWTMLFEYPSVLSRLCLKKTHKWSPNKSKAFLKFYFLYCGWLYFRGYTFSWIEQKGHIRWVQNSWPL